MNNENYILISSLYLDHLLAIVYALVQDYDRVTQKEGIYDPEKFKGDLMYLWGYVNSIDNLTKNDRKPRKYYTGGSEPIENFY